jgi:hypothetical protein
VTLESIEIATRILAELAVLVALFVGWGTWRRP